VVSGVVQLIPHVSDDCLKKKNVQVKQVATIGESSVNQNMARSVEKVEHNISNEKSAEIDVKAHATPNQVKKPQYKKKAV
jgi:hypothetical protein